MTVEKANQIRIVLVDDEPDFLELMRLQLEDIYDVVCFNNGQALLDQLPALRPDLLILDIHMPVLSGLEVCRRVRVQAGFSFLPILFLTASREERDWLASADYGANAYLHKPIETDTLRAEVEQILSFQAMGSSPR